VHKTLATDSITITDRVDAVLTPVDQTRDWRRRWTEVQRELGEVLKPRQGGMSGDAIHAAANELHSFFIHAYHLKDALKADAGVQQQVSGQAIECAITNDPDLALLADLANLDKHFKLNNQPRSGDVPTVARLRASTHGLQSGWRLVMTIEHAGQNVDGLDAARGAVDAWDRHLRHWKLS